MKNILILIALITNISLFSQTTIDDNIQITIIKSRPVDNVSIVNIRPLKVTDDRLQKVMVKTKIKSKPENKTKLSAFSVIDTINKLRYRLADYKGYTGIIGYPELKPFLKTKLLNDKGETLPSIPPFDKTEKDYFYDYNMNGYENVEGKVNFGTKKSPKLSIIYIGETKYDKFTAELFFTIYNKFINSYYELYYKDQRIGDIKFD